MFKAWWNRKNNRPLLWVMVQKERSLEEPELILPPKNPESLYMDVERKVAEMKNILKTHIYLGESFPRISVDLGPGSMALYLGSKPIFAWDTLWYEECILDWEEFGPLWYDSDNFWFQKHLSMVRKAQELSQDMFLVDIPDIIENVDILAAMRGAQRFCYDLVDQPELMKTYINQVDELYFRYYDAFYNIVKGKNDSVSYNAFNIWGPGKTAKVQCDFSALMSPTQFRDFVLPSLCKQCEGLDNSLYHLDGPDAIKHLDALMEIDALDALQWTSGAGQPDGASELWYPVYDKVKHASKGLWIPIYDGNFEEWLLGADKLVRRYGPNGLYLLFPVMTEAQGEQLLQKAEKDWK
jgi:5-methyltetrahydrofolate--homocysteine methyltransferase